MNMIHRISTVPSAKTRFTYSSIRGHKSNMNYRASSYSVNKIKTRIYASMLKIAIQHPYVTLKTRYFCSETAGHIL